MSAFKWLDNLMGRLLWAAQTVIILSLIGAVWFALDRETPYRVIRTDAAEGRPGQRIVIRAEVWRDTSRRCDVVLSRQVIDASGVIHASDDIYSSAQVLAELERRWPREANIAFDIPPNAAPGPAVLYTSRDYRCNKVHHLWPIHYVTAMPFTVLAASSPLR